jgi:hypothetical protein
MRRATSSIAAEIGCQNMRCATSRQLEQIFSPSSMLLLCRLVGRTKEEIKETHGNWICAGKIGTVALIKKSTFWPRRDTTKSESRFGNGILNGVVVVGGLGYEKQKLPHRLFHSSISIRIALRGSRSIIRRNKCSRLFVGLCYNIYISLYIYIYIINI